MRPLIALVTEPAHPELRPDDQHLVAPLAARGIDVEAVPWGAALDPARHTLAVLRTPWDYFLHAEAFLAWCDAAPVPLLNPPGLVRWNAHKRYLLELERAGAARISPTTVLARVGADEAQDLPRVAALAATLHGRASDDPLRRLVIKPALSGGAHRTFVLDPAGPDADTRLAEAAQHADVLVQRYEPRLVDDGEWSLVLFDGVFSHALRKFPSRGDFRVQECHGGRAVPAAPPARLLADADRVVRYVARTALAGQGPLYARVDGFTGADGGLVLVELELIEPELFLRFGGAEACAAALARACEGVSRADRRENTGAAR